MSKNKSSISKASSYQKIGEYWDTHDLGDVWEQTEPIEFNIDIQLESRYYAIEFGLSEKIKETAKKRGISPETLVNLWLQEKIKELKTSTSR